MAGPLSRLRAHRAPLACAVVVAALALSGCTSSDESQPVSSATVARQDGTDAPAATSAPPTSEPLVPGVPAGPADPGTVQPAPEPDAVPTSVPVELDEVNDFGGGVTVGLERIDELVVQARGPGEVSGPGLAVVVSVTNSSDEPVDLSAFLLNLTDSEGVPGIAMFGDPAAPVAGPLEPGATATGTYVFAVDESRRSTIRLEASYSTDAPTVVFTGDPGTR